MQRLIHQPKRKQTQHGMVLVATMMVLMGLLVILLLGIVAGSTGTRKGGAGLMSGSDDVIQLSTARINHVSAFNMADSGIQYTIDWMQAQSAPPANTTYFGPSIWGGTVSSSRTTVVPNTNDTGSYFSVRIYPDYYNPGSTQKKYLVESIGTSRGVSMIIQAYIQESSLSKYLVLLNQWNDPSNYWVQGLTTFDGPVHDNNANGIAESVLWDSSGNSSPIFTYTGDDAYTVSGSSGAGGSGSTGAAWWKDQYNTGGVPSVVTNNGTTVDQWSQVLAGGKTSFQSNTAAVAFPTTSTLQASAALGSSSVPTTTGVLLTPGAGIYIHGNVDDMALSATGTNGINQQISVTQHDPLVTTNILGFVTKVQNNYQTTITIDAVNKKTTAVTTTTTTTTVTNPLGQTSSGTTTSTSSQNTSDTSNGVVYTDGNIGYATSNASGNPPDYTLTGKDANGVSVTLPGGLHGVVADNYVDSNGNILHNSQLTIATSSTNNTNLDGSVTYNTQRQIASDASGPIYTDVNGTRRYGPTSPPAIPSFIPESQDSNFTTHAGTLGVISKTVLVTQKDYNGNALTNFAMDGTVLAYNLYDAENFAGRPPGLWENMGGYLSNNVGTFGQFGSNNKLTGGFNTQFNYDQRMRDNPPPYFPTTGNYYDIVSWQVVQVTLA